jgi:impB/mucB/samB family
MFATIYLPNFYLQAALRHQAERHEAPVALIDGTETRAVIMQLNAAAIEAGVAIGMTPSQGLARCLALLVKTRVPAQEDALSDVLLQYSSSLSPYLEATAPGVCTIQFTHPKNAARVVARVVSELAESEVVAQAGLAETPETSLLAAHLATPVVEVGNAKDFLAPLPIETLLIG